MSLISLICWTNGKIPNLEYLIQVIKTQIQGHTIAKGHQGHAILPKTQTKTNGVPAAAEMWVIKKIKLNKTEKISNLTSGIKWSKGQNTMRDSWCGR